MEKTRILGLMSGTSLDGLDMALCEFSAADEVWSFELLHTAFKKYSPETRIELKEAIKYPVVQLLGLHQRYGNWLGETAAAFLQDTGVEVDAIASHGHTIHHRPEAGFTFQLGCPQRLALKSGVRTIADFRTLDIALGGQGAPLVPTGDRLLFGEYRFCLNLGGICNISFEKGGKRIAFDIGIANMLLNHLCSPLGLDHDREGHLARSGKKNIPLLEALDQLEYYQKPHPKSTGFEWFRDAVLPLLDRFPDQPKNLLHTAVWHIAGQISRQINLLSGNTQGKVLVTGGGALNTYLMEVLAKKVTDNTQVVIPDVSLINYKEALVFAFLGALRLAGKPNVFASVTGASADSCSGVIYLP